MLITNTQSIEWWQARVFSQSEEAIPMSLRRWWPLFWALLIDCRWYAGSDDHGGVDDGGGRDDRGVGVGGWFESNPNDLQVMS